MFLFVLKTFSGSDIAQIGEMERWRWCVVITTPIFPKVVVSLTTPRTDKVEWNDNCDIVCILVRQKLRDIVIQRSPKGQIPQL